MKKGILLLALLVAALSGASQEVSLQTIRLNAPSLERGTSVMQALTKRQSTREFADRMLSLQDFSDLVWAANGINRPESGKRTAPSAMNRQDIKVYVCLQEGAYLYDEKSHTLVPLTAGDVRSTPAPVCLVLVADKDVRFAEADAGIVSQNISLFCAGVDLATYCRGGGNKEVLTGALQLNDEQVIMLNHPVGYFK